MIRRMIFPILLGLIGAGILVGLGTWQLQRLTWKEALLANINARITAAPVAVPLHPDPQADNYLPVLVKGHVTTDEIDVLASRKEIGAGYRIISVFVMEDGRRLLLDRGFVTEQDFATPRPAFDAKVLGNLQWPSETDSFTPDPDRSRHLWFARDVPKMAAAMGTEPVLIVAREVGGDITRITPLPADTSGIPNDHLQYAITWFSLAFVWLGMTGLLLWRIRRRTV